MHIKEQKKELRKRIKELKKAVSAGELKRQSQAIQEKVISSEQFKKAKHILLYWALPDEVDTKKILNEWHKKKQLFLPVIKGNDLDIVLFEGEDKMVPDAKYGIPEPVGEKVEDEGIIDLVVVPGMAFDKQNNRLGRGAGYYDRILKRLINATKAGLAFDFQYIETIPVEPHDIKMDMVFTFNSDRSSVTGD